MLKHKIESIELTNLGLGGGKFVNINEQYAFDLVDEAFRLGINVVDAHHRYGHAEKIFGQYNKFVKMTKISAYKHNEYEQLINNSNKLMKRIDIMWVSDLDDISLYETGEYIYNKLKDKYLNLGITTENSEMAGRFMCNHPECKFFMVPVHIGMTDDMIKFINFAKLCGKIVFAIKTTLDGLLLRTYNIEQCLKFVREIDPHVTLVGTKNIEHLRDTVNIWKSLHE